MKIKFAPTTIWAFQAAVSIILAFSIGNFFHLEKSYWAVLTCMLLISQTWGESLKKALERVMMTILGGIVGTTLYFSMSHDPVLLFFVIIIVAFCMVYCMGYSFKGSAFFVTIFIVFLFAMIGNWDVHILEVRIYETLIGAATAVITSIIVFPAHSQSKLQASLKNYISESRTVVELTFDIAFNQADSAAIVSIRDQLYKHFREMSEAYKTSSYEMFFMFVPRKKSRMLINEFAQLMHYITNLLETSAIMHQELFSSDIKEKFAAAKIILLNNLEKTTQLIDKTSAAEPMLPLQVGLTELNELLIQNMQCQKKPEICSMHGLSFIYYLKKIDEILLGLEEQLREI